MCVEDLNSGPYIVWQVFFLPTDPSSLLKMWVFTPEENRHFLHYLKQGKHLIWLRYSETISLYLLHTKWTGGSNEKENGSARVSAAPQSTEQAAPMTGRAGERNVRKVDWTNGQAIEVSVEAQDSWTGFCISFSKLVCIFIAAMQILPPIYIYHHPQAHYFGRELP